MKIGIFPIALSAVILTRCSSPSSSNVPSPAKPISKSWIGQWERSGDWDGAELDIKIIKDDSIAFSLSASNGGHSGELEGTAVVRDSLAVYFLNGEGDSCRLHFILAGDSVVSISQLSGICGAGAGVSYAGRYKNSRLLSKDDKEEKTLVDLGVLKTPEEDAAFKKLVGDAYGLFTGSTQQVSEDDDLDNLHTRVYASGVTGLYTVSENIIMIDSAKNIWAAVINNDKVDYYTNTHLYTDSLPKTVDNWRQRFKDYKVVYKH